MKFKISLNQINIITGDIDGNYQRSVDSINKSLSDDVDIIVLPETSISGYCCGALWDNIDFIIEQENKIKKLIKIIPYDKALIIGYVSYHGTTKAGLPLISNSVAVINQNKMFRYDKQLLANADHHEDKKYFKAGKKSKIFNLKLKNGNVKIGTPICEDAWYINHKRNIPKEMCDMGAKIIIVPNQSYFYYHKDILRKELFSNIAKDNNVPVISVNSCGVGDIVKNIMIFDGSSMVFDKHGNLNYKLKKFDTDYYVVNFNNYKIKNKNVGELIETNKYKEIINAIIYEQRELFKVLGLSYAQVHISGGVDSAIVAALMYLAMGKDGCVFITNPTSLNSDSLPLAHQICNNLGVHLYTNNLEKIYQVFKKEDEQAFGGKLNTVGLASVQAVLRTVQGLAASHRFKTGIVATGNQTEIILSWNSFHDIGSIGVHAPIADLTKLELFEMCYYLNNIIGKEVIPEGLFNGTIRPAAELPDSKYDPIDYYIQSGLCAEVVRHHKSRKQLICDFKNKNLTEDFFQKDVYDKYTLEQFELELDTTLRMSKKSVFKAAQAAPTLILSPRSRGFSNRETLINYYKW